MSGYACGVRVVVESPFWEGPITGSITRPAVPVDEYKHGCSRVLRTPEGRTFRFWWVRFDSPAFDADGDGPYSEGEVDEEWLSLALPDEV